MKRNDNAPTTHSSDTDRQPVEHIRPARNALADGSTGNQSAGIRFYWDLLDDDVARMRSENLILEDEGYLAHDILWGRRLLDLRQAYVPLPDVDRNWAAPLSSERFSDAISAILQVAVSVGLDPVSLCADALATREGVEMMSAAAASRHDRRGRGPAQT